MANTCAPRRPAACASTARLRARCGDRHASANGSAIDVTGRRRRRAALPRVASPPRSTRKTRATRCLGIGGFGRRSALRASSPWRPTPSRRCCSSRSAASAARRHHAVDAAVDHDRDVLGDRRGDTDILLDDQDRHLAFLGRADRASRSTWSTMTGARPSVGSSMTRSFGIAEQRARRSPASAARRRKAASRHCRAARRAAETSGRRARPSRLRRAAARRQRADARRRSGCGQTRRPCGT